MNADELVALGIPDTYAADVAEEFGGEPLEEWVAGLRTIVLMVRDGVDARVAPAAEPWRTVYAALAAAPAGAKPSYVMGAVFDQWGPGLSFPLWDAYDAAKRTYPPRVTAAELVAQFNISEGYASDIAEEFAGEPLDQWLAGLRTVALVIRDGVVAGWSPPTTEPWRTLWAALAALGPCTYDQRTDVLVDTLEQWPHLSMCLHTVLYSAYLKLPDPAASSSSSSSPSQPRLVVHSAADALAPQPPTEWVVERVLPRDGLVVVYGASGSLKSLLCYDMLAAIASGQPWLPSVPNQQPAESGFKTAAGPVLLVDVDQGEHVTRQRVRAVLRARGLDENTPLNYICGVGAGIDARRWAGVEPIAEAAVAVGAVAVLVDNLGAVSAGADENSTEMVAVMGNLRRVGEVAHAGIVTIHHSRKMQNGRGSPRSDSMRGSTAIAAALDLGLEVLRPDPDEDVVTVAPAKNRRARLYGFGARFEFTHWQGEDLDTARFWAAARPDSIASVRAAILDSVANMSGQNKSQLVEDTQRSMPRGVGVNKIRDCIDAMVRDGLLEERPGPRTTKLYFLALPVGAP